MIGSIAIDACASQYASACPRGSRARKLSAWSWMKPVSPTRSTIELVGGGADCAGNPSTGQRRAVELRRKPMVLMGLSLQPAQHQKWPGPHKFVRGTPLFGPDIDGQAWY